MELIDITLPTELNDEQKHIGEQVIYLIDDDVICATRVNLMVESLEYSYNLRIMFASGKQRKISRSRSDLLKRCC